MIYDCCLPIRLVSEANSRDHWRVRARRVKHQRAVVCQSLWHGLTLIRAVIAIGGNAAVTLTRLGVRALDGDNLQSACKAARDGMADALGIRDDSDPRITWRYDQETGSHLYGLRIRVEARATTERGSISEGVKS